MLELEYPKKPLGEREWCEVLVQLEEKKVVRILLALLQVVHNLPGDGRPWTTDEAIEGIVRTTNQWLEDPSAQRANAVFDNFGEIVFGSRLSCLAQSFIAFFNDRATVRYDVDRLERFINEAQKAVAPKEAGLTGAERWGMIRRGLSEHLPPCLRCPDGDQ